MMNDAQRNQTIIVKLNPLVRLELFRINIRQKYVYAAFLKGHNNP